MEADIHFKRFKVLSVENTESVKILKLINPSTDEAHECHLSGSWYHSYVSEGDIVHIQSNNFSDNTYCVDDKHGLITIKPDTLIAPTSLSRSVHCMRRAWLEMMFTTPIFTDTTDEPSFVGRIVHSIFQTACGEKSFSLMQLEGIKNRCLQKESVVENCRINGIDIEKLTEKVNEFIPSIFSWFEEHFNSNRWRTNFQVKTVEDIEEILFCPSLGVEGSSDVTCGVEIHGPSPRKVLMPLELKTGRAFTSYHRGHRTQVMTYIMGMKERGPNRDASGLLLYLRNKKGEFKPEMSLIQMKRADEVELLQRRNKLAHFLSPCETDLRGPEFVHREWHCNHCNVRFECSLMAKSFEQDAIQKSSSFRQQLIHSEVSHLRSEDIEFFQEWMRLIKMKKKERMKGKTPYWIEPSSLREKKKLGLSNLTIQKISGDKITFRWNPHPDSGATLNSFPKLLLEEVVISADEPYDIVPRNVVLFSGWVLSSNSEREIEVLIDREVHDLGHTFQTYRLDFLSSGTIYSECFGNLNYLMSLGQGSQKDDIQQLRNAIIGSRKTHPNARNLDPRFPRANNRIEQHPSEILDSMENCVLIHRIPGFNKKIVEIVEASLKSNESVLISSHSHSTLDSILCKLKNCGIDFVRSGPRPSIHSDIRAFSVAERLKEVPESSKLIQLGNLFENIKVTGIKYSDIRHKWFLMSRRFDVCIIDEADKIPLPMILNLLFISNRFLLIGEDNQPSNAKNEEFSIANYGGSLFKALLRKNFATVVPDQYHMNQEIMSYSSKLFYRNTLRCGSQEIAETVIPQASDLTGHTWLDQVLSNDLYQSFLFLNTDNTPKSRTDSGKRDTNILEAELCMRMLREFIQNTRISSTEIGILSPFRGQVSLIREMVKGMRIQAKELFVDTIDKSHQEERAIVLISFVKQGNSTDAILSDAHRLKISLTRAARKLIFIGSKSFLRLHKPFNNLFNMMKQEQFIPIYESLSID